MPASPAFFLLVVVHMGAGLTCVVGGAVALLSPKRRGRHPRFGEVYFWALAVVFATTAGMAGIRWAHDAHLFVLGCLAFGAGSVGYVARKRRWPGWLTFHLTGMSLSYLVLLTAFYVDNGPHLPLWNRLPVVAFWVGPSLVGLPLLARALRRHTRPLADLRAAGRAVAEVAGAGGRALRGAD
jgi:hypothetical protein